MGVQGWVTRAYERLGPRYAWLVMGVAWFEFAMISTPAGAFIAARHWGLSVEQTTYFVLAVGGVVAVAVSAIYWRFRTTDDFSALRTWLDGDRTAEVAAGAIVDAQRLPRWLIAVMLRFCLVLAVPVGTFGILVPADRVSPFDVVLVSAGTALTCLYALMLIWFWLGLSLRPGIVDAARLAPEANRLTGPPGSLSARLLVAMLSATSTASIMAISAYTDHGAGADALLVALAVSAALSLGIILTLIGSAGLTALGPVRDLTQAARAVGAGDLHTRVAVTNTDELGLLTQTFNDMVEGLEEREALRGHNAELNQSLLDSRARIVATADAERRRMERDLHDGAQQHLVLLRLKLGLAERALARDPATAGPLLEEAKADLESALSQLRDLAHGIYPAVLESDGIAAALRDAALRSPLPVTVEDGSSGRYPPAIEAATYFCCLEALQNAAKHAGDGASVTVGIDERDGSLIFEVSDDGAGCNGTPSGNGLTNMADRVGALGGEISIESRPGRGTKVRGRVPVADFVINPS